MPRSLLRWLPAAVALGLTLVACHERPTSVGEGTAAPVPTGLLILAGNYQNGMAGRWLGEPLAVRVSDAAGRGIERVAVSWTVSGGSGVLCDDGLGGGTQCQSGALPLQTPTDADGRTQVRFKPARLGRGTVTAAVFGTPAGAVTFSVNTAGIAISLVPLSECSESMEFHGPDGGGLVTAPVGVPVEWELGCGGRITSTSAPAGQDFDSGTLPAGGRFRFVPQVAGQWDYREVSTEASGRLIAVGGGSPDSTVARLRLAFTSCMESDIGDGCARGGLTVLGLDGSEETVGTAPIPDDDPAWSPDGAWIALTGYRHCGRYDALWCPGEIYVMSASGSGEPRRLTQGASQGRTSDAPAWSPDGARLAFSTWDELGGFHLYLVRPDGSELASLGDLRGIDPAWSPDGSRIAFAAVDDAGRWSIYISGADGSAPIQVTHPAQLPIPGGDSRPSWSSDGRRLAFQRTWTLTDGSVYCQVLVMDSDGSNVTQISHDLFCASAPAWSPDGARIAFLGAVGMTGAGIWLSEPDGSNAVLLRVLPSWPSRVTWVPLTRQGG
jgi:hypothetical protein